MRRQHGGCDAYQDTTRHLVEGINCGRRAQPRGRYFLPEERLLRDDSAELTGLITRLEVCTLFDVGETIPTRGVGPSERMTCGYCFNAPNRRSCSCCRAFEAAAPVLAVSFQFPRFLASYICMCQIPPVWIGRLQDFATELTVVKVHVEDVEHCCCLFARLSNHGLFQIHG